MWNETRGDHHQGCFFMPLLNSIGFSLSRVSNEFYSIFFVKIDVWWDSQQDDKEEESEHFVAFSAQSGIVSNECISTANWFQFFYSSPDQIRSMSVDDEAETINAIKMISLFCRLSRVGMQNCFIFIKRFPLANCEIFWFSFFFHYVPLQFFRQFVDTIDAEPEIDSQLTTHLHWG